MLRPIVVQRQHPRNSDRLRLDDLTPAFNAVSAKGGFGSPNIDRSQVDFVVVQLTAPDGVYWTTGPLMWYPTAGSLDLLASDFLSVDDEIPTDTDVCAPQRQAINRHGYLHFVDGIYELTYEIWGKVGIPAEVASYHLKLKLCQGEQVWVMRMGAWADITDLGTTDLRGNWTWSELNSSLVYEQYEIRQPLGNNTYKRVASGDVQKVALASPSGPMTTSADPRLVGATTIRFMLTGVVSAQIAQLAKRPLTDLTDSGVPCGSLTRLALARQQLDTLILEGIADETAPVLLEALTRVVASLHDQALRSR